LFNFTFEIDDNGAVLLYDGVNPEPFMFQPNWPDGTPWGSGEAEAWAAQVILSLTDPEAQDAGDNPESPTKPKYVEAEPEALPE